MIEFFHGNTTNMYSKILQPKDTIWTVKYKSPSKDPSVICALEVRVVLLVRQQTFIGFAHLLEIADTKYFFAAINEKWADT